jgi:hypothetical protein
MHYETAVVAETDSQDAEESSLDSLPSGRPSAPSLKLTPLSFWRAGSSYVLEDPHGRVDARPPGWSGKV